MRKLTTGLGWSTVFLLPATTTARCDVSNSDTIYDFAGHNYENDPEGCAGYYRYIAAGGFGPTAVEQFKEKSSDLPFNELPGARDSSTFTFQACKGCYSDDCDEDWGYDKAVWAVYAGQYKWCEEITNTTLLRGICDAASAVEWQEQEDGCDDGDPTGLWVTLGSMCVVSIGIVACMIKQSKRDEEQTEQSNAAAQERPSVARVDLEEGAPSITSELFETKTPAIPSGEPAPEPTAPSDEGEQPGMAEAV